MKPPLSLQLMALAIVQAQATVIPVPNGSFETLYKPGSTTITADTGGGWTRGAGFGASMDGTQIAKYSDATTGTTVDVPGWVNATGWTPCYSWSAGSGSVSNEGGIASDGANYYMTNGSGWGNQFGGAIQSAAPLTTVGAGQTYTLSMDVSDPADPVSGRVLDLLADGVPLTPTSSANTPGTWTVYSNTYSAASLASFLGKSLTIRVGWAMGATGTQSKLDNVQLTSLVTGTATVGNLASAAITSTTATLQGAVTSIGAAAPTITIFWGPNNGGSVPANWSQSITLPGTQTGAFSTNITALSPASVCFFTVRANNSGGDSWATPSASFTTLVAKATVGNLASTAITSTTATLQGAVTAIGDAAPTITIFWGPNDGGSVPANWSQSITLPGTQTGAFSTNITALSPASVCYFTVRANNSGGDSWATRSASFETGPGAPTLSTAAASKIGATMATLGADVTATGGEVPAVTVYYGTSDGGSNAGAWQSSVSLGSGSGGLSAQVLALLPATTYYFRAYGSNSGGTAWAPSSLSFLTLTVTAPSVENRATEAITGTTASLRGEVTVTGNDPPALTLFYGTADGGTDTAAWTSNVAIGKPSGNFSHFVTGLTPGTAYFFRWRATNQAATAWSLDSGTFTTTALVTSTCVITEFHYHSLDNTSPEEFIELHNPGDTELDLSGWTLSNAVTFTFPPGTTLPAHGYRVIAENPAFLESKFSITGVLGPWIGKLSSTGERIDLRDAAAILKDRVTYSAGFPWPTGADGAGSSCELIDPSLDNDLGSSWRSSGTFATTTTTTTYVAPLANDWKYHKGTAEASSPVEAWRAPSYNDNTWSTGQAPIGYKYAVTTTLVDMQNGYSSVYFRKSFMVPAGRVPKQLKLRVQVDDGCVVWINGTEVARLHVPAGQLAFNALADNHDLAWEEIIIPNTDTILFGGTNVITVHGCNRTLDSSDFSMDLELSGTAIPSSLPTPGSANSAGMDVSKIPPQIRQVDHSPKSPVPNEPVTITAKITDPDTMGAVTLAYQLVDPGAYIRKTDATYATSWTSVTMVDDGTNGDAVGGDSIYTAVLPASLQTHRRLVRYKISFADALGNAQTVPYADDEQPNFAYFVYGPMPSWTGAMRPEAFNGFPATAAQTYPSSVVASMPALHLVANSKDVADCQYNNEFIQNIGKPRYFGTIIQRGVVHDHIEFRVRSAQSPYIAGKNKWKFYFNRARDYQGYDNYGNPYKQTWNNLVVNANANARASVHRGSAGVEEAVSNRVYQLCGMASMNTQFFQLRVIDDAVESSPTSQYEGDLWGIYLSLEPTEGNFLDERGFPDGNIYDFLYGVSDLKHQGATQPTDSSDWITFRDATNPRLGFSQTEAWYRANIDLPSLYTFLALNRLIGNVDVRGATNYRLYHRPTDGRWVIIPYDLDMMFIAAHHWGTEIDGLFAAGVPDMIKAISRCPNLAREYRNRCREILSLMAADGTAGGGQIGQLFQEYAQLVNPVGQSLTWANLDAAMWNLNPHTKGDGTNTGTENHKGNFFRANYLDGDRGALTGTSWTKSWVRTLPDPDGDGFSDHAGSMQWFVNYATNTYPTGAATWSRKAMPGVGEYNDPDVNRQKGYGYKYLEFESLYGGWINCNVNPTTANNDYPNKPTVTYAGPVGYPVSGLNFTSSAFIDPQGAATYAAHEWRVAEISSPGIAGYVAGTPCKYEVESPWSSGELTAAPGAFSLPSNVTTVGKTYRARVRHMDATGNWSYWSDPVQFTATPPPPPGALIHYWNFNSSPAYLAPTYTAGGATINVAGTYLPDSGQLFAALNARNSDVAGSHLRVNNPLTLGTLVDAAIPTTGYTNILVQYETRRSGSGAGSQLVSYTLDGTTYIPLETLTIIDAAPVVKILDFRTILAANNNPNFALRITFAQGAGGTVGNNRFDNLTVEGDTIPGIFNTWKSSAFPNAADRMNPAISGPNAMPAGDGVCNLMRYALGVGPYEPVTALMPTLTRDGSARKFRFPFDPTRTDLIWRVQATHDLSDWSHVVFDSQTTPIPPLENGSLSVTLPEFLGPGPAPDPQMFTRLEVRLVTPQK